MKRRGFLGSFAALPVAAALPAANTKALANKPIPPAALTSATCMTMAPMFTTDWKSMRPGDIWIKY